MTRTLRLLLVTLALAGCRSHDSSSWRPAAVLGPEDPMTGNGPTFSISATFSKDNLKTLYDRLNAPAFQDRLRAYTCGDPVPKTLFTVSLFEAGEYQERQVLVQPRPLPDPGGPERCLNFGVDYEIEREIGEIDHGEPINYHYKDPHTGKEFPPSIYKREEPRQPICDCSKRFSKGEWVSWPPAKKTSG